LAQAWPTKAVKIVMPSTTAGSPDRVTRLVAEKLALRWGQPVLVENRPGATTVIGTEYVARQPADGYTLLSTFTSFVQAPALMAKALRDYTAKTAAAAAVAAASAFRGVRDLLCAHGVLNCGKCIS
jgi:tripartite-type tricarboxylate transporter receptor subunit TctC